MRRLPKPYRFPLALAVGVTAAALTSKDYGAAVGVAGTVVLVILLIWVSERAARRRTQARRASMPYGSGVWRGRVDPSALGDLVPVGFWKTMAFDLVTYDVVVTPDALLLEPAPVARRVGRFAPIRLTWDQVVQARELAPVRELGGKPSVVALTPVTFVLLGVDDWFVRPLTDEEAAEEGLTADERAEADAEALEFGYETFGSDWVPGTHPLRIHFADAEGLVDTVSRYARGQLPAT